MNQHRDTIQQLLQLAAQNKLALLANFDAHFEKIFKGEKNHEQQPKNKPPSTSIFSK